MRTLFSDFDENLAATKPSLQHKELAENLAPWQRVKQKLKLLLPEDEYSQWIAPLSSSESTGDNVVIYAPTAEHYHKILDNYLDLFDECRTNLGIDSFFHFDSLETQIITPDKPALTNHGSAKDESHAAFSRALSYVSQLNKEYIFSNFVNGPSNQFAHASCLAVADSPGRTYNPLFLYGSTGLGKTHLLHAVGNSVLSSNPDASVTYISSERFMNEMIYCLRFNKMWDFRQKYRSCDVLLVDDIQFISGKERTQEEFFHTFNALYEANKQIIVTSDIFPQEIPDIEDRLRNRFQWGLIADIQPPDIEHRVAILMNKADQKGVSLPSEAAQYIAAHSKGSIRVLEGALRRVIAYASLQGKALDLKLASEVLQSVLDEKKEDVSIDQIQRAVADHFQLKLGDLRSKKRQRIFSAPRQIAMYLCRQRTSASFPEIGSKFGGKDHTTVMHAVKKVQDNCVKDLEMKLTIETINKRLDLIPT